ncbi:glutamate 5-kinase [Paralimibaculum aggregatum]|uniref:glutamate 5-kinase n=1 Tax=Paralimibaculum aggregatum TaxID=3036245 RepID=UPI003DA18A2C
MSGLGRLAGRRRIVVKIGSALLVDAEGRAREDWLAGLVADMAALRAGGVQLLAVSSGAIALGRGVLGLGQGALTLERAQAAAAVGQQRLSAAWTAALGAQGLTAAQVLLTLEDTQNRRRYLNGRATLKALIELGAVPVVNENDTVATDEIRYGDNDRLAARVALMAGADLLVLLSDVDGLYTANPRHDPAARHIPEVAAITPEIEAMAGDAGSGLARGGMRTKVLAAKTATAGGCAMAVMLGDQPRPLTALAEGCRATWFRAAESPAAARKQWIAGMKPLGTVTVDAGAVAALERGRSLLPAGVTAVTGRFERGDPVAVLAPEGTAIGAGLAGYRAEEARAIAGAQSARIEEILGYPGRAALVHRDDLVIWDGAERGRRAAAD